MPIIKYCFLCFLFSPALISVAQQRHANSTARKINKGYPMVNTLGSEINLPYADNIEMAGKRVASFITYKIDNNNLPSLERNIIFPQQKTHIRSTDPAWYKYRAYLKGIYKDDILLSVLSDNRVFVTGAVQQIEVNGMLQFVHLSSKEGLQLTRTLVPNNNEKLFIEQWTLINSTNLGKKIKIGNTFYQKIDHGQKARYNRTTTCDAKPGFDLKAGEPIIFSIRISTQLNDKTLPATSGTAVFETRKTKIQEISSNLILETPDPVLNTLISFLNKAIKYFS